MNYKKFGAPKKILRLLSCFFLILFTTTGIANAKMVSVAGDKLNLRSGPGTKYPVQWEYGKGFPLMVKATKGSWYKVVDFENDTGWVYRKLVTNKPHLIVKEKIVNIRKGPGEKYKLIGKAKYGVVLKTLSQQSGWAKVQHISGLQGWIKRDLLWGW